MGIISQTLGEILDIPGYEVFLPHDIIEYDRLKCLIVNKYYNREIAYDTVDYFRMKLNYQLEINAERYNKMLASERVQYDPFMTDYIHTDTVGEEQDNTRFNRSMETDFGESVDFTGNNLKDLTEGFKQVTEGKAEKDRVTLANKNSQSDMVEGITTDMTDDYIDHEQSGEDLNATQNGETHANGSYSDHNETDGNLNRTVNENYDRSGHDNQTARNWKENGDNKSHRLNVSSDTPMSMLFNTPNHYYGTGTASDSGVASGGVYTPYKESDISTIDSSSRQINGGDTPWFNYASAAGNQIGDEHYGKSGSETYNRDHDETGNKSTETEETTNETSNANGTTKDDGTSRDVIESKTVGTRDLTHSKRGKDITDRDQATTTSSQEEGELNENESTKTNQYYDKDGTIRGIENNQKETNREENTKEKYHKNNSRRNTDHSVRSGRTNRSPAKLIMEYREAITYNADLFMIGQLESCFLQIF